MTECERIIKQGILPESFFNEELRCGYRVSKRLKKIWAVAIATVDELDRICKKHNLRYFLACGSLLGAVRHQGFVPWDDDMDVYMLREDYDKLLSLKGEFREPFFLQTPYTDPEYFFSYAKIRNSNTSCITTQFRYQKMNWGQNLDIFPLDNFPATGGGKIYDKIAELGKDISNYMRSSNPNPPTEEERERINNYSGRNPLEIYEEIQSIAQGWKNEDTGFVSSTSLYLYGFKRGVFRKEWFSDVVISDFECRKLPIPIGYDEILKVIYGDYMKYPPLEQRGIWHSNIIYDPDIPYLEEQRKAGILY